MLFIALILMGLSQVSTRTIRALGFFSFLLFFEVILLLFKKQIYPLTHGEPWMDLAFMVALAAIIVPLHHWAEHQMVNYLCNKKTGLRKPRIRTKQVAGKEN